MKYERDVWALSRIARDMGVGSLAWARNAVQMLAAVRTLHPEDPAVFFDDPEELTGQRWSELRQDAEKAWRVTEMIAHGAGRAASPFNPAAAFERDIPGFYELLRRSLGELVRRAHVSADVVDYFDLCLAIHIAAFDGEKSGAFILTESAKKLIDELLDGRTGQTAYCAFEPAGEIALLLARQGLTVRFDLIGEEAASYWAAIACASADGLRVFTCDPFFDLLNDWEQVNRRYDLTFIAAPFSAKVHFGYSVQQGLPPATSEAWAVALAAMRATALGVCLLPNGFLFRTSLAEQSFKDKAFSRYGASAVIGFPPKSATASVSIRMAILVIEPNRPRGDALMVDLDRLVDRHQRISDENVAQVIVAIRERRDCSFATVVPLAEIAANDFNISVDRYVLTDEDRRLRDLISGGQALPLDEIAELYRAQATPARPPSEGAAKDEHGDTFHELAVSDLDEVGLTRRPAKILTLGTNDAFKVRKAQLQQGDVLLVTKGSVGRVGFVQSIPQGQNWIANQIFAILRLRKSGPIADPRVLFRFLSSGVGQSVISGLRVSATVPMLQMPDVRKLMVLVPPAEQQAGIAERVEETFRIQAEINALRDSLSQLQLGAWPENAE